MRKRHREGVITLRPCVLGLRPSGSRRGDYETYATVQTVPGITASNISILTSRGLKHLLYDQLLTRIGVRGFDIRRFVARVAPSVSSAERYVVDHVVETGRSIRDINIRFTAEVQSRLAVAGLYAIDLVAPTISDAQLHTYVETLYALVSDSLWEAQIADPDADLDDILDTYIAKWKRFVDAASGASYWPSLLLLDMIRAHGDT